MRVFISYKSQYRPLAIQLRDRLKGWGYDTWFDQDNIPEGAYFRHEIQQGLESSEVVVGIMTAEAFLSREVMWEWDYAIYNSRFIPLRYQDVKLPYHLQGTQYIDFVADTAVGFENLRSALSNGDTPTPTQESPQPEPTEDEQAISYRFSDEGAATLIRGKSIAPKNEQEASNRETMLNRVHDIWVEGVLERNVQDSGLFAIGMEMAPGAVLKHRDHGDYTLPDSSRDIVQVFNDMRRELLILGSPGSGKTMLMLQLARKLIDLAQQDEQQPIPVVFNLSSWAARRRSLDEWLIDELAQKYYVPKKVAKQYIENEQLLLLLDGLDEVNITWRDECVTAINAFRAEYRYVDLVVCSRIADYEALTNQLNLTGAIALQPLTDQQVEQHLQGNDYAAVRARLKTEPELAEIAQTPFLLNTIAASYRSLTDHDLVLETDGNRLQHLFDTFSENRIRTGAQNSDYTTKDTRHYLSWLAKMMVNQSETLFFIPNLNPKSLGNWKRLFLYQCIAISNNFTLVGMFFGAVVGVVAILGEEAQCPPTHQLFSFGICLTFYVVFSIILFGILGAFVGAIFGTLSVIEIATLLHLQRLITIQWLHDLLSKSWKIRTRGLIGVRRIRLVLTAWQKKVIFFVFFVSTIIMLTTLIIISFIVTSNEDYVWISSDLVIGVISGVLFSIYLGGTIVLILTIAFWGYNARKLNKDIHFAPVGGVWLLLQRSAIVGFLTSLWAVTPIWILVIVALFTDGKMSAILQIFLFTILFIGGFTLVGLILGGLPYAMQYYWLRRMLQAQGALPPANGFWRFILLGNYAAFLDHCANIGILRKIGNGYMFRHRYLLEYFAGVSGDAANDPANQLPINPSGGII